MKRIIIGLTIVLFALSTYAQKDVTQFLGIPVDGSKTEMIQKLKAKGFHSTSYDNEVLKGEFNGTDVNVFVATNGNKVCRIMLCDDKPVDERSIQIRFNKLCRQFESNPKYLSLGNELIPDNEDIAYEITVNNKRYEAIFYQINTELPDTARIIEKVVPKLLEKYTYEEIANPTEEIQKYKTEVILDYLIELCSKKPVWFMISKSLGYYFISMFYDNEFNRANGEDL